jgi:uncharacterized protein (DUF1684 family)
MSDYEQEILGWRKTRLSRLIAPESWLSLVNKVPLPEGECRVGSDPTSDVALPEGKAPATLGRLLRRGAAIQFLPEPGVQLGVRRAATQVSEAVSGPIALKSDQVGEPDRLVLGSLVLEIMQRNDSFAVRVRDTESPARSEFAGIDYYPIQPEWRVQAELVPYSPHKRIEMLYETGDTHVYHSPGAAVFEWQGTTYRVDPVLESNPDRLFVLFGDQTNRDQTYGAGRFLYAPMPQDGKLVLDFNQAFSPPCAFTDHATCPLPPPQNRLQLRVEAGEKRPRE